MTVFYEGFPDRHHAAQFVQAAKDLGTRLRFRVAVEAFVDRHPVTVLADFPRQAQVTIDNLALQHGGMYVGF